MAPVMFGPDTEAQDADETPLRVEDTRAAVPGVARTSTSNQPRQPQPGMHGPAARPTVPVCAVWGMEAPCPTTMTRSPSTGGSGRTQPRREPAREALEHGDVGDAVHGEDPADAVDQRERSSSRPQRVPTRTVSVSGHAVRRRDDADLGVRAGAEGATALVDQPDHEARHASGGRLGGLRVRGAPARERDHGAGHDRRDDRQTTPVTPWREPSSLSALHVLA